MNDPQLEPSKVVIRRRGEEDIVWSTEDGLRKVSMAPFGVVGEFEGKEVKSEMVSWYEVSSYTVYDLDFQPSESGEISMCTRCDGTGLVNGGEAVCSVCDGYGHTR